MVDGAGYWWAGGKHRFHHLRGTSTSLTCLPGYFEFHVGLARCCSSFKSLNAAVTGVAFAVGR